MSAADENEILNRVIRYHFTLRHNSGNRLMLRHLIAHARIFRKRYGLAA